MYFIFIQWIIWKKQSVNIIVNYAILTNVFVFSCVKKITTCIISSGILQCHVLYLPTHLFAYGIYQ